MGDPLFLQKKYNLDILGRCRGWRPSSLLASDVETFKIVVDDGKRCLEPVLGSMPASLDFLSLYLFSG